MPRPVTHQMERSGRVAVVVLLTVLGTVFMGLHGLEERTRAEHAVPFLTAVLAGPYEEVLALSVADGGTSHVVADGDLVVIHAASRAAAEAEGPTPVAQRLAAARAAQIHRDGFPEPGDPPTFTGFPRRVLEQYTDERHERVGQARFLVGIAAGVALVVALITGSGTAGAFFSLPGFALGAVWISSRLVRVLMRSMFDRAHPNWRRYQDEAASIMDRAELPVQFGAVSLVVAGAVFGFLGPRLVGTFGSGVGEDDPSEPASSTAAAVSEIPPSPEPAPASVPDPTPAPGTSPQAVAPEPRAAPTPARRARGSVIRARSSGGPGEAGGPPSKLRRRSE